MLRGDRLRQLRLQRSYTHEKMAELLSLSVRQIARYESGETDPSGDIVARIAEVLAVSTDYLLGRADDPTPYMKVDNLTPRERRVLAAMRRNAPIEAIREIVEASV